MTQMLQSFDPATGDLVWQGPTAHAAHAAAAVARARAAAPGWARRPLEDRIALARAYATTLDTRREDFARLISRETGKLLWEARTEVTAMIGKVEISIRAQAERAGTSDTAQPFGRAVLRHHPHGVVAVLGPYNFPGHLPNGHIIPALLAGNTAIVKPPPSAPLATTRVVQRVAEKLPPGVLNVVTGRDENMAALIQSPDVAKVCFTGSVNGGKRIMEMASSSLTRVTLELGGNDAAIFLEDAEVDDVHLDRLYAAIFDTTGQICMNAKRVFVHRSKLDEVVDGLSARLDRAVVGYGLDEGTTMGPLHQPAQKAFVEALIAEAKSAGADVREFGTLPEGELAGGNFVRPTIVVDPDLSLRVVTEEQFGPVIPVIPFDSEDQAVALANDTWGGLCGSVWTSSADSAKRVGSQMQCGYVWVNDHGATRLDLRAPFGGMKQSGFGREQGIEGVRAFQDTRSIATIDAEALAAMAH